jgi:nucleotide-binding universal stress UspA family protein
MKNPCLCCEANCGGEARHAAASGPPPGTDRATPPGMSPIARILVPTDFSEPARAAERYALELADRLGAEVTLLSCYQAPVYALPDGSAIIPDAQTVTTLANAARDGLERERTLLGRPTLPLEVADGAPAETIVDMARRGFDLIIMGTHGRTGFRHFLLGSVAERVLRLSTVPVLTVHAGATLEPAATPAP